MFRQELVKRNPFSYELNTFEQETDQFHFCEFFFCEIVRFRVNRVSRRQSNKDKPDRLNYAVSVKKVGCDDVDKDDG